MSEIFSISFGETTVCTLYVLFIIIPYELYANFLCVVHTVFAF